MLISAIAQIDTQTIEFSNRHATSQITPSEGGRSFADYLAATSETANADQYSPAGSDARTSDAAKEQRDGESTSDTAVRENAAKEKAPNEKAANDEGAAAGKGKASNDNDAAAAREAESRQPDDAAAKDDTAKEAAKDDAAKDDAASARDAKPKHDEPDQETIRKHIRKAGLVASDRRAGEKIEAKAAEAANAAQRTKASEKTRVVGENATLRVKQTAGDRVEIEVRTDPDTNVSPTELELTDARDRDDTKKNARGRGKTESEKARIQPVVRDADQPRRTRGGDRTSSDDHRIDIRDVRNRRSSAGRQTNGGGTESENGRSGDEHAQDTRLRSVVTEGGRSDGRTAHGDQTSSFETMRSDALGEQTTASRTGPASGRTMQSASEILRHTLRENLNGEIVRSARLVVRGDRSGEIRLQLKPEQLGNVRISLQMQDGHIAGRIIVENQSVREVFEQNLAQLQRAFQEGGLDASGLEVTVADSGNQSGDDDQQRAGGTGRRGALASLENAVPDAAWYEDEHDLVDMVV